jgi:hypothetical protein
MPKIINLSSSAVNSPAGDFTTVFTPALDLSDGDYEVALLDGILWNSVPNISAAIGNNTLSYSPDGGSSNFTVTFPDGVWSVNAIASFLADQISVQGNDPANLVLVGFPSPNLTQFQITSPYTVTLPFQPLNNKFGSIAFILGFDRSQQGGPLTVTTTGNNTANVSNGFSAFLINFPGLVDGSTILTNGTTSSAIFAGTWTVPANARNPLVVFYPAFVKVTQKYIQSIQCRVTNQDGIIPMDFNQGPVEFGNPDFSNSSSQFSLVFRKIADPGREFKSIEKYLQEVIKILGTRKL